MERFDSVNVEVKINDVWVDLSSDVLASPEPRVNGMGLMGLTVQDRVGGAATFTFALNNSPANSVGTRGYYSPGRSGALSGWTTGLPVRLYFVYDGVYKQAFYGKILPNGITVTPGIYGKQDVRVECSNWFRDAQNRTIDLIGYETNLRSDAAISRVVTNMPTAPLAVDLQAGTRTFPGVFDTTNKKTKGIAEIQKITMSEFGYCYLRGSHGTSNSVGGETLVYENRTNRYTNRTSITTIPKHSSESADFLLLETGDKVLLETGSKIFLEASQEAFFTESDIARMAVAYGNNFYNRAKLTSYPRKQDTSPVVLWTLEEPIQINGFGTVSGIRGGFRDPNGKSTSVAGVSMISPVASTDYLAYANSDATGTNLTANLSVVAVYGTAEVEYSLTNTGATTMYVTTLQARGYGVYLYDTASVVYEDTNSIQTYGPMEVTIDMPYVADATNLFTFSNNLDRVLAENGDYIITEDSNYLIHDDSAGIFDFLIPAEPRTEIESITFVANRNKFNMMAFMALDAGSYIKLSETMTGINSEYAYVINGYDFSIKPGGIVEWTPALLYTLDCPKV